MKHIRNLLFGLGIVMAIELPAASQTKLQPDAAGCSDSTILPKLINCRIDNCEKKESDHRDMPIRENEKGEPVNAVLDGDSQSVMYECTAGTTPAVIAEQAAIALRTAGFPLLYKYVDKEATLTARKGDLWLLLEAASRYYTLVELKADPPDFESITDASGFSDAIERYGRVPVYGIHFMPGRADMAKESEEVLSEVAAMLQAHPAWRIRIESHTDNAGPKMANMTLSARRASAVLTWLVSHGIKRLRLEASGLGDTHPVADNATETGRAKNERIEIVKLAAQQ